MPESSNRHINHCGSELGLDSGGSTCINAECAAAFASKLCSHRSYSNRSSPNRSDGCTPPARARPAIRPPRAGR
ncbi:hypothetical protein FHJ31_05460 [Pseudomonas sp. Fig-3]|nr:hypothetical protein FHJ31_05460 [Pseudomonas sp. Fig-3]